MSDSRHCTQPPGADQVGVAKLLMEADADIETRSMNASTPLMMAAGANAVGAIELLVTEGAHIDAKEVSGATPLLFAVTRSTRADAARKLVELGADVNGAPDTEPVSATTPLAAAIARGQPEIADILRAAGAVE